MSRKLVEKGFFEHQNKLWRNVEITILTHETTVSIETMCTHLVQLRNARVNVQFKKEMEILLKLLTGKTQSLVNVLQRYGTGGNMQLKVANAVCTFYKVLEYRMYLEQKSILAQAFKLAEYILEEINGYPNLYLENIRDFLDIALVKKVYSKAWMNNAIFSVLYK